MQQETIKTVV